MCWTALVGSSYDLAPLASESGQTEASISVSHIPFDPPGPARLGQSYAHGTTRYRTPPVRSDW